MIVAKKIIGNVVDPIFAGKDVDWIDIPSCDAIKRILHCTTVSGVEVALELPRGTYLSDGAVVEDLGSCIVAIRRKPEEALVVCFDETADPALLVTDAARLGHAFGNQHLPIEVHGLEIRVPITTSKSVMEQTLEQIGLHNVAAISFQQVRFALNKGFHAGSHHGH